MPHLKRDIGLFGATVYCLGIIIGAGVYVLIGEAASFSGNALWMSFLVASIIAGIVGISYAELSSMIPRNSAEFLYSKRAFNRENVAFAVGWIKLLSALIAGATVSIGFGRYLSGLTGIDPVIGAILLVLALVILNLVGVKQTIKTDIFLVSLTILGLLVVIISGIGSVHFSNIMVKSFGWEGIFSAAALIFFAYLGFEDIANLGEETKNPRKVLPLALVISVGISALLYVLVAVVSVSVVPWKDLVASEVPLALVASTTIGPMGGILLSVLALFATASTVLGFFLAYSRMTYGMAEEGIFPKAFLRLTGKSQTPYFAIMILGVVSVLFILFSKFSTIAFITDFGAISVFLAVNISLLVLRYKEPFANRGFKVPLNITVRNREYSVIPVLGIVSCMFLLAHFEVTIWIYGSLLFFSGIIFYYLFNGNKVKN